MLSTAIILNIWSSIIVYTNRRKIGSLGNSILTISGMCSSGLIGIILWLDHKGKVLLERCSLSMLYLGDIWIAYKVNTDWWSVYIILIISTICTSILVYNIYYMDTRDISLWDSSTLNMLLSLFSNSMFVFITSSNLLITFIGYEFIGWISYLLINTYGSRIESNKSSLYSMILGKTSDMGILMVMLYILGVYYTVDLCNYNEWTSIWLKLGVLTGIMSKSVQVLLLSWIILAMNGPIPVSSLLLSSTLVTSGVLYVLKLNIGTSKTYTIIGLFTTILVGTFTILVNDCKRLIAWSTSTQMSFVLLGVSIGSERIGIYLILTLGYIKGLLFMSIGVYISLMGKNQDIRKMSGIYMKDPYGYSLILICCIGIVGVPYLSIYYSKDLIIDIYNEYGIRYCIIYSSLLTVVYTLRLLVIF